MARRRRALQIALLLVLVAGGAGGAAWVALRGDATLRGEDVERRAAPDDGGGRDADAAALRVRRAPSEVRGDDGEPGAVAPPAGSREERLQWIREWIEIALGSGYSWQQRAEALRALPQFEPDEVLPLLLDVAEAEEGTTQLSSPMAFHAIGLFGPRAADAVPRLVALVRENPDRRAAAADALARIGAPAVAAWLELLAAEDEAIVVAALGAVPELQPMRRDVVVAIAALCGAEGAETRTAAAWALCRIDVAAFADVSLPPLMTLAHDADVNVRRAAVYAIHAHGAAAEPAAATLAELLTDDDASVATAALLALGGVGAGALPYAPNVVARFAEHPRGWDRFAPGVLRALGLDALLLGAASPDARVRRLAILEVPRAVQDDGDHAAQAVAALVAALDDADASVRAGAAWALGRLGPAARSARATLLAHSGDADAVAGAAALIAAVRVGGGGDDVLATLRARLVDEREIVRVAVLDALREMAGDAAPLARAVGVALDDPVWSVREAAARVLGAIGPAASAEASGLAARFGDPDERVRLAAALAYLRVEPPGLAARDVVDALRVSDVAAIRAALVQGLGEVGHPAWLAVVVDRLEDRDVDVRVAALHAVARFGAAAESAVPAVAKRLRDERRHVDVQRAALDALRDLGPIARAAEPDVVAASQVGWLRDAAQAALDALRREPDAR